MSGQEPTSVPPAGDLPDSGRALQPFLWSTIELWHHTEDRIDSWEDAVALLPPPAQDWSDLVARLQMINTFQWHEEDRSHDPDADQATLAAVKRSIDASNGRRVRAVEELDDLIFSRLMAARQLDPEAPLHSESPASIVDRLSVLALKVFHTRQTLDEARRNPSGPQAPEAEGGDSDLGERYERLRSLTEQVVDLTGCLDRLLDDLRAGKVSIKLYRQVKIYQNRNISR